MAQVYTVPSISGGLGINTAPLDAGTTYVLEASGTYQFGSGRLADAEFLQETFGATTWVEVRTGHTSTDDVLDIVINGAAVDWLGNDGTDWATHTFSQDHVYRYFITGTGAPINLTIADWEPLLPSNNEADNSGSLTVTISAVPESMSSLWVFPIMAALCAIASRRKLSAC